VYARYGCSLAVIAFSSASAAAATKFPPRTCTKTPLCLLDQDARAGARGSDISVEVPSLVVAPFMYDRSMSSMAVTCGCA
jgi:hypothetical protein